MERWNPADGTFTTLASATRYRGYHSIALLLPDGRVLSSGGDGEPNGEVFSPPYLFKGARPTITSVPATLVYGQPFSIATPDAAAITAVTLVRLSAVTHSTNMNQRFLRLSFTPESGVLNLTTPSAAETAPPGDYMLFVLNGNGVPSVASIVRVGLGNPPAAPSNLTATAVSSSRVNLAWRDNASTRAGRPHRAIDRRHDVQRIDDRRPERDQLRRRGRQSIHADLVSHPLLQRRRSVRLRGTRHSDDAGVERAAAAARGSLRLQRRVGVDDRRRLVEP